MADELPQTLIENVVPEPSLMAQTWSGRTSFQTQAGLEKDELKQLQEVVCKSARAHLDLRATFTQLERDRGNMRLFLAECRKSWPKLGEYKNGWPAKSCLRLLMCYKSKKLLGKVANRQSSRLYPASLPAVRSPRVARRQKSRQGSESSSLSREQTNPLPDSNIPTPPALKDHAFAAFLRNIDPSLPLAQQALYMLGIQTPALINSFAYLPNRDGWLRSLMEEGRLDLKTFQVIRTAMTKHCLVTETPPPRFISRFRPTLSDSNIVQSMLDSIYPRLGHLRLPMEKLGIVTANDLEAIVKSTHRDREFLNTVLKTGIMSPIEAMLVCNAFTVLAATGILAQLKPVD